jgi:hypothetical protein
MWLRAGDQGAAPGRASRRCDSEALVFGGGGSCGEFGRGEGGGEIGVEGGEEARTDLGWVGWRVMVREGKVETVRWRR